MARVRGNRDSENYSLKWRENTYTNKEGFLVMPHPNLMACLFDGARTIKVGKSNLSRSVYSSITVKQAAPLIMFPVDDEKVINIQEEFLVNAGKLDKEHVKEMLLLEQGRLKDLMKLEWSKIHIDDISKREWIFWAGAVRAGRRIDSCRTKIPAGWSINFSLRILPYCTLSPDDIRKILLNSGGLAALCDWRLSAPKKPGPYGQFELVQFDIEE